MEEDDESHDDINSALLLPADLLDAEYPNRLKNASLSLKFRDFVCSLLKAIVEI